MDCQKHRVGAGSFCGMCGILPVRLPHDNRKAPGWIWRTRSATEYHHYLYQFLTGIDKQPIESEPRTHWTAYPHAIQTGLPGQLAEQEAAPPAKRAGNQSPNTLKRSPLSINPFSPAGASIEPKGACARSRQLWGNAYFSATCTSTRGL